MYKEVYTCMSIEKAVLHGLTGRVKNYVQCTISHISKNSTKPLVLPREVFLYPLSHLLERKDNDTS